MADVNILFYLFTEFISVHTWHHYITDYNVGLVPPNDFQSLYTICSCIYLLEVYFHGISQEINQILIIIYYKQ